MSTPTEMHIDALMEKIEELKAENARYREAFLKINIMVDDINSILYHIVREALKGE